MDYNVVKENLAKKTSDDLLKILEYSQDDYTPEAILILKVILLDRGIDMATVGRGDNNYKILKNNISTTGKQNKITKPVKSLIWIISALSLSILLYLKDEILPPVLSYIVEGSKKEQYQPWTNEFKRDLKANFMKGILPSQIQDKYKIPLCDCFIKNLQIRYPNGPKDSIPKVVEEEIFKECAKYVKEHVK